MSKQIVERVDYIVRATLTVVIPFSPIPRDTPLSKQDAIANATGTVSDELWEQLESEGWDIEFDAERI